MASAQQQQHKTVATVDQSDFASLLNREFSPKTDQAREAVDLAVRTLAEQALASTFTMSDDAYNSIEAIIGAIDTKLSEQINLILHHEDFQKLESAWRGLHHLVSNTETDDKMRIRVMDVSKEELRRTLRRYKGIVAVLAVMLALVVYLQHRANQALTDKVNQLSTQVASVESAQSDALAHLVVSADLGFAPGRAELTSMLARQLDQLATALATTRGVIKIVGHTDDSPGPKGSLESNLALSEARAMAVGRYLHGRGIAMGRMVIIGRGAQDPIGDNRTAAGRALNRRVEITLDRLRDAAS